MSDILKPEDYKEPVCPFCIDDYKKEPPVKRIPIMRVIEKLDMHFAHNDTSSAKRHLLYWLEEARTGRDKEGELSILEELMGLSRKMNEKEDAYRYAEEGISLMEGIGLKDHISGATTYINAATVYKNFDEPEKALKLYRKAQLIYEAELNSDDPKLAGLYNNMALALADCNQYDEAEDLYNKALDIVCASRDMLGEAAVTCLNLADLIRERDGYEAGEEVINECLDKAEKYLDDKRALRDGNYAFICSKCAPVFGLYGRFAFENELAARAEEIYERN